MRKILLTGSNGFLGQHISKIANQYDEIELSGWSASGPKHTLCKHFQKVDLISKDLWEEDIQHYDVVIHTAALSQIDYCENNRNEAFLVNTEATRRIADACKRYNKQLIHLSTDFVFSGREPSYTEVSKTAPVNFYGRTKEAAEIYIQDILPNVIIVRPVLIFGNILAGTRSNLVLWVRKSLNDKQEINVVTNHYRTPTFVNDLAQLCLNAAINPVPGIYHACGTSFYSVYELANTVAEYYGLDRNLIKPVHSDDLNAPGVRPEKTKFDPQKSIEVYGFSSRTFEESLSIMDQEEQ